MSKQSVQIIIFFILALFSYAVWKIFIFKEIEVKDKPFTKGYSIDNLELRITDEKGHISARFISPSLLRYTDSDIVLIKSPKLWTYEQGEQNWNFSSKQAEYNHKQNRVNLIEQVKATNLNSDSKINFTSNDLNLDLVNKLATTDNGIKVEKEQMSMSGEQADFDFKNDKIEVKNNVKVIYKSPK